MLELPGWCAVRVLVVVAHPDDEALGFGATGARLADTGVPVRCCFLSGQVTARAQRPADEDLQRDTTVAQQILGFGEPMFGPFPNIQMNSVPHIELVQFIEQSMRDQQADTVVTHHPHDINDDHRQVALAAMAAARLHQRQSDAVPALSQLLHMEILSSTEWQFPSHNSPFNPDTYVEMGAGYLDRKIQALEAYRGVMRPYPHPRSRDAINAQAVIRGAESGLDRAEAFVTGFRSWQIEWATTPDV